MWKCVSVARAVIGQDSFGNNSITDALTDLRTKEQKKKRVYSEQYSGPWGLSYSCDILAGLLHLYRLKSSISVLFLVTSEITETCTIVLVNFSLDPHDRNALLSCEINAVFVVTTYK